VILSSILSGLNAAKLWRWKLRVWGRTMQASSLDRLVYLILHRANLMGADERHHLTSLVRPGMQIVDIGANIGLYSLLLAELAGPTGQVFAFEPEPQLYRALQNNCRSNQTANISTVNCALGSAPGQVAFFRSVFNSGDNRLGGLGWKGQGLEVEMARLDDVLPNHQVDFIKMDVQGFEQQVLKGMDKVFAASSNLTIYFEFWPFGLRAAGTQPQHILDHLFKHGFQIYRFDKQQLVPVAGFGCLEHRLPGQKFINLLASRSSLTFGGRNQPDQRERSDSSRRQSS